MSILPVCAVETSLTLKLVVVPRGQIGRAGEHSRVVGSPDEDLQDGLSTRLACEVSLDGVMWR